MESPIPEQYSIGQDEFTVSEVDIERFSVGDRVTRNNFLGMLILSFAVSKGKPAVQTLFFKFLNKRFGFDYESTINGFVEQGGWYAFTDEERKHFMDVFRSRKKHASKFHESEYEYEIADEIQSLIKRDLFIYEDISETDFTKIDSLDDFNKVVAPLFH